MSVSRRSFGWGEPKKQALEALLRELVVVPIDRRPILENFGHFHSWTRSVGKALSDNDLWIAATSAAIDAHLVTTDKDFDVLHPELLRRTLFTEHPGR